jgi:hypothetical protein
MEFAQSTMTEVFLQFPHLSEDIFNVLDNKTFVICKEVSEVWYNYLDDQKFVQERRVRMIKKMIKKFQPDFQQNLEVVQANISLAQFPDDSFRESNWLTSVDKASLHTEFSSAFDTAKVQTILHEARYGNFDVVDKMILVEFKRVYCSWSQSSMIIYRLATRSKHEEVMNYVPLKYRFVNIEEYLKSLMPQYLW